MRNITKRISAFLLVLILMFPIAVSAEGEDDAAVQDVTAQLEAIDTLQEIQDNRSLYKVKNNHYDTGTTNETVIAEHEAARTAYESYVSTMFSARLAAKQAYEALTEEQQEQIDPTLVEKLDDTLSTSFKTGTYSVTPRDDEYTFEAVKGETGLGYEVSNHMVSGEIPQTFILVDTANGETSWTPNGKYVYGESNYIVAYCCDVMTGLSYGTDYKRVNLEDSGYYGADAAKHIRAILQSSYPYISVDEMKERLIEGGLDTQFVESLTRADMISAVQMAVWSYANANDGAQDGLGYFASVNIPKNTGIYFTPLHDYTNECWDWLPGKRQRSFDARAEYRVNNLAYFLCNLPGVEADKDELIISDVEVTRAELVAGSRDTYYVGMYVHLNNAGSEEDDLTITATSYSENEDGTIKVTGTTTQDVNSETSYGLYVKAKYGDTIKVVVEGTQYLAKGVYFYEPEGGRDVSQSLVGMSEGKTNVRAEEAFTFSADIDEMGLRIYKTANDTGLPLSDITFSIYSVNSEDELSTVPTNDEIEKYATDDNLIGSVTTDTTGYASKDLEQGTYLIVEEHNTEKVKAPVAPFYITVPMTNTVTSEDGTTATETLNIVSVYPKNEPIVPPEEPPVIPPVPNNVTGRFSILKYDESNESVLLEGAQFQVYRAATEADEETTIISDCEGIKYSVVPVMVNDEPLILTTGEDGTVISPALACGVYFVTEVKAPVGYILDDDAVSVNVIASTIGTTETVKISNQQGSFLPETGGMGTTWFMLVGSILIVGAGALLITRKYAS